MKDQANADAALDVQVAQWNAALASGDASAIDATRRATLRLVNERIMNDDPRTALAGWVPTAPVKPVAHPVKGGKR